MDIETAGIVSGSIHFGIGLIYHLVLLYMLIKFFEKRAD
ncbi:hypothetical protein M2105_004664 [Paenibacillus sp. PastF-1]|nr:hypothetical protein [Paenibacillus sp. PastF-2]MDF9850271.1 hypothetical protein [Paenibacillus sp. PastM-2]MDF9856789.1 hypothetical protein [Paenibacillus sp. PastF-1]